MMAWLKYRFILSSAGWRAGLVAALVLACGPGACNKEKGGRGTESPSAPAATAPRQPLTTIPELGPAKTLAPGIVTHDVVLREGTGASKVRVYLPKPLPAGKIPCVFVAPAGTPLIYGNDIGEGYHKEEESYVRQGFAVVFYSIAGDVPENAPDPVVLKGARAFMAAQAGLYNAQDAIDFALARVPQIDPDHLYTAGHSSAGTLSLLVAENEPRIKGCVAYAPATDVVKRLVQSQGTALASPIECVQ